MRRLHLSVPSRPEVVVAADDARHPRRRSRSASSTTSRRSSTASASRSSSSSPRSCAAGTLCSRTCPAPRRPCSPARSPARSAARTRRASSARPTSSRPTSPASRSSTRRSATSSSGPGPVFANVVLVDEINRAMPKTQSALLEAMAEQQVTVDGETRRLEEPVPRHGDAEPDRVRGDVPAPRGAARPLLREDDARLPRRRGRGADRRGAARRPPARRGSSP